MKRFLLIGTTVLLLLASISGAAAQERVGSSCEGDAPEQGVSSHTIESGGITRDYLVYIPASYEGVQRVPLVVSLHGFASNAEQQAVWSLWNELADKEGFIVVYPQGTDAPARWNSGQRRIASAGEDGAALGNFLTQFFEEVPVDDVAFFRDLLDTLEADYCVDPARIYVNGLSNGAGMTNRLACELSSRIAAVGMVAGAYTEFPGGCDPIRAMPVIAFHGVLDPIVPYEGDPDINFPPIENWVADWAARNRCDPAPRTVEGTVGAVTGIRYGGCAGTAEVIFYSIADGGHTWPGGTPLPALLVGKTSEGIDASETMWRFFQAHPLDTSVLFWRMLLIPDPGAR